MDHAWRWGANSHPEGLIFLHGPWEFMYVMKCVIVARVISFPNFEPANGCWVIPTALLFKRQTIFSRLSMNFWSRQLSMEMRYQEGLLKHFKTAVGQTMNKVSRMGCRGAPNKVRDRASTGSAAKPLATNPTVFHCIHCTLWFGIRLMSERIMFWVCFISESVSTEQATVDSIRRPWRLLRCNPTRVFAFHFNVVCNTLLFDLCVNVNF